MVWVKPRPVVKAANALRLLTRIVQTNERVTQTKYNLGYVLGCGEGGPQTPLPGNRGCLLAMVASNDCPDHGLSWTPRWDRLLAPGSRGSEDLSWQWGLGPGTEVRTLAARPVSRHSPKISRSDPAPRQVIGTTDNLRLITAEWGGAPPAAVGCQFHNKNL